MPKERVEKTKIFKNGGVLGNNFEGSSSGTIIFQNENIILGIVLSSECNIINLKYHHIRENLSWVISNTYTPNNKVVRNIFWDRIVDERKSFKNSSWMVIGDLNPLKDGKKLGVF